MHPTRPHLRRHARALALAIASAVVTLAAAQTVAPPAGAPVPRPTLMELMTGMATSASTPTNTPAPAAPAPKPAPAPATVVPAAAAPAPVPPAAPAEPAIAKPVALPAPAALPPAPAAEPAPAMATATALVPPPAPAPDVVTTPARSAISLANFVTNQRPPSAPTPPATLVVVTQAPAATAPIAPAAAAAPAPAPVAITPPSIRPPVAAATGTRPGRLFSAATNAPAAPEPLIPPIPPAATAQEAAVTAPAPAPAAPQPAPAAPVLPTPAATPVAAAPTTPAPVPPAPGAVAAPAVPAVPSPGPVAPPAPPLPPGIASNVAAGSTFIRPVAPPPLPPVPGTPAAPAGQKLISLNFQDAPIDQVLQFYSELTGRTMIKSPGINAVITLRGQARLTEEEVKEAIESVLALNNVTLVPLNDKFLKVIQPGTARQEGMPISVGTIEGRKEGDNLVTHIVELKHVELTEVMTVLQTLIHGYGKVQPLERTNGLMITDTRSNLQRALEVIEYLDKPVTTKVETRVYELREAEAAKVATQLNELIADAQNQQQQRRPSTAVSGVQITIPGAQTPPGVIRAPVPSRPTMPDVSLAERGIVVGQVKIVPDERTNVLIVISDPMNFVFFDNIIAVLDRAIEPEIVVNVYPLEFADAEEVSNLLNELTGTGRRSTTSGSSSRTTTGGSSSTSRSGTSGSTARSTAANDGDSRSQSIRDFIARQAAPGAAAAAGGGDSAAGGIGELSPNTRILSDKRSNSILLMGRKTDINVLLEVTKQLDVILSQVIIEAIILEVNLGDNVAYGVDWLQRSLQFYEQQKSGPGGGVTVRQPVTSLGGGFVSGSGSSFRDGAEVARDTPLGAGALTYYLTAVDMNLDAVIRMAASSSDAKILSTPVILTTDNQEASIVAGEERPIVNATTVTEGGNQTAQYEYRNIGIELTVKPHINPERVVVMDVKQTADNVGDIVKIDGNDVPVITKREMKAQISVEDRSTIVLGGLVSNSDRKSRTKIPFLGDIPILGRLFRSDDNKTTRTELLVLITPYVVRSPEEARAETRRLHDATEVGGSQWYAKSWADGDLAQRKRAEDIADKLSRDDAARSGSTNRAAGVRSTASTNEIQIVKPRTLVIPSPGSSTTSAPPRTIRTSLTP